MSAIPEEDDREWWEILATTLAPQVPHSGPAPALDIWAGHCTEAHVDCPRDHWASSGYWYHALKE